MKHMFLLFAFLCGIYGCRESTNEAIDQDHAGNYSYSAFDKSGNMIVTGWLTLSIDSNKITGDWNLNEVSLGSAIGPHTGTGKLIGSIENDDVLISLNPNMADNNITLIGKLTDYAIEGVWRYDGFAGNLASGKFLAKKK